MKKIKTLSLTGLTFLCLSNGFSQNIEDLKNKINQLEKNLSEKKVLIEQKNNEITGLIKENIFYKQSLKIVNSKPVNESNGFEFKIISAKGDLNSGKILINVLVENKGLPTKFQPNQTDITDTKGNNYKSFNHKLGQSKGMIEKLQKNIPTKMTIEFNKVREEIPIIKSLNLFVYDPNKLGRRFNLTFENIPVTWSNLPKEKNENKKTKMKVW